MRKSISTLYVQMNGLLIGHLQKHANGALSFAYDPSWLQQVGARPISLSLPLRADSYQDDRVYHFFDNLLPDNPQVRARIQTKFQTNSTQPFDLLSSIGRDCVGAIQLSSQPQLLTPNIKAKRLTNSQLAEHLRHYQTSPLGMLDSKEDFRISIAGAQEKSAFLFYRQHWHCPLGTTPTSHIFKLPIGRIEHQQIDLTHSCENEWLCMAIAKAFGLPMAETTIEKFDEIKTLIVSRFDRKWSTDKKWLMRLPQEDMCQALGYSPNLKYEADGGPGISEIMQLLLGSSQAVQDRELFFQSQILFYLLAAIDGHAKNFSLHLEPGGKYRLTPLYDIISAHPLIASKDLQAQKIKMAMALLGENKHYHWHTIQRRHFLSTANATHFSPQTAELLLTSMLEKVEHVIQSVGKNLPSFIPKAMATTVFKGILEAKQRLELKPTRSST